jgi:23S rRNA pseudouridine2605 synthase
VTPGADEMEAGPRGERLQKALARAGVGSRRAVEELIVAGRVRVNGAPAVLGRRVDVHKDKVEVDGSPVPLDPELVYYLLNKPEGVVSTAADPEGRETVVDLVDASVRVWPVGRLDVASEGALVLTNDGELTLRLTHPRYEVPKSYLVEVAGAMGGRARRQLARGVALDDGTTRPASVEVVDTGVRGSVVEITISEGRNKQVRRMMEAVGHPVRRLVRTSIGPLKLGRLKPGTARRLSPAEVRALYAATGSRQGNK